MNPDDFVPAGLSGARTWLGQDHGLTARESDVMVLIAHGLNNREISARLFVGVNTIKTNIRTCYQAAGVESRTQAVLWAVEHGFRPDLIARATAVSSTAASSTAA